MFAAVEDPFPNVSGRGLQILRDAGVEVEVGLLAAEARRILAPFLKLTTTGLPYVHAKWAMTIDGRIATRTGDSQWISGERSRGITHALRGRMDGIVVGIDAKTSRTVYARAFPRHVAADQPRRLEPVLRSGALFVPQEQVHVLRPRDGELLATLPSDLIPDLLRVDEACNVYVAEESGHLAAFGVAPRLTLVR